METSVIASVLSCTYNSYIVHIILVLALTVEDEPFKSPWMFMVRKQNLQIPGAKLQRELLQERLLHFPIQIEKCDKKTVLRT